MCIADLGKPKKRYNYSLDKESAGQVKKTKFPVSSYYHIYG